MLFIFDENFSPKLAEALNLLEQANSTRADINSEVQHIKSVAANLGVKPENGRSYLDHEVIRLAGKTQAIIVTQDDDFMRIKSYYPLYKEFKVGVIYLKPAKGLRGFWEIASYMVSRWQQVKKSVENTSGPFCFVLTKTGIQQQSF